MSYNVWTEEMLNFIKDNYNKLSDTEISKILMKSVVSVRSARRRYHIIKDHSSIRKIMFKEGKIVHPNTGKKLPKKQIEKRLETLFKNGNNKSWNKGLKGVQVAWNKGLTKETDERVEKYSKYWRGRKRPEISGNNHHNFGKTKENLILIKKKVINY